MKGWLESYEGCNGHHRTSRQTVKHALHRVYLCDFFITVVQKFEHNKSLMEFVLECRAPAGLRGSLDNFSTYNGLASTSCSSLPVSVRRSGQAVSATTEAGILLRALLTDWLAAESPTVCRWACVRGVWEEGDVQVWVVITCAVWLRQHCTICLVLHAEMHRHQRDNKDLCLCSCARNTLHQQ